MALFGNGKGMLGLGGMGGMQPAMPQGLLDGLYDPQAMRAAQIKSLLMGAGVGLMSQGPSDKPINFMTSLGQGLGKGMEAAQQTGQDYRNTAMQGYQMKTAADDRVYGREQDAKKFEYGMNRDQIGDSQFQSKFKYEMSRDAVNDKFKAQEMEMQRQRAEREAKGAQAKVFGTPLWGTDGKPYYVDEYGNTRTAQGVPDGVTLSDPYVSSFNKAKGTTQGKLRGEGEFNIEKSRSAVEGDLAKIDEVINHKGRESATGTWQGSAIGKTLGSALSNNVADFNTRVEQLKGGAFLQAYETLKGGGPIANAEGQKAEMAIARLNQAVGEDDFKAALNDYKAAIIRGFNSMAQQTESQPYGQKQPTQGGWSIEEVQ
jgi:hypothetical protein